MYMYIQGKKCTFDSAFDTSQSINDSISISLDGSTSSKASDSVTSTASSGANSGKDYGGLDFKIIWDHKTGSSITIHLVAPTMQEKAVWISDISQVSHFII